MSLIPATQPFDIPEESALRGIEFLSLQGGGMKGIGDVGVLEELEAARILQQVKEVAGTSVGGLVAALLALGYTAKEIRDEMLALNFKLLQDKESPGWIESSGIKEILQGGFQMLESVDRWNLFKNFPKVRQAFAMPASAFSYAELAEDLFCLGFGKSLGLWRGEILLNLFSRLIARKTGKPNLTFKELAILADLKPNQFRKLHLTSSNLTTQEIEILNADNTPDVPIIDGLRITTAFPFGFTPYTKPLTPKEQEDLKKGIVNVRVDGGLLQNLPTVFDRNPKALAIVFKTKKKDKKSQFKNGFELAQALYKTALSDNMAIKHFENRTIAIDTEESQIDTLDFDATKEQQEILVNEGKKAARKMISDFLNFEKINPKDYQEMSIEELIRHKIALQHQLNKESKAVQFKEASSPILANLRMIDQLLNKSGVDKEEIRKLEKMEKEKLLNRIAASEDNRVVDEEFIISLRDKKQESVRLTQELYKKYRQLKLVKQGLQWRLIELTAKISDKNFKNDFYQQLGELANFQESIKKAKDKKILLEANRDDMSSLAYEKQKKEIDSEYRWLKHAKELYFKGILTKYRDDRDELMCQFFEELNEDSKKINFVIPEDKDKLKVYYGKEIEACESYMQQCKQEIEDSKSHQEIVETHIQSFTRRKPTVENYEFLKEISSNLYRSIYQQTSLIAKINHYLIGDEKSTLKTNVVTGFMQAVAFLAFLTRVALVIPPLTFGVAHLIRRFSPSDNKLRATADRVIEAFNMPKLFKLPKLNMVAKVTAQIVKKLDENYYKMDITEHSYLFKLLSFHLKNTGISAKDIFPKKEDEKDEDYELRITALEKKLSLITPEFQTLIDKQQPGNKNLAQFRRAVLTEVLKMEEPELKRKTEWSEARRKAELESMVMKQNLEILHKEFIHWAQKRLENGYDLTRTEMKSFVESREALHPELSENLDFDIKDETEFKKAMEDFAMKRREDKKIKAPRHQPEFHSPIVPRRTPPSRDKK